MGSRCRRVAVPVPVGRPQIRYPLHQGGLYRAEAPLQAQLGGALLVGVAPQRLRARQQLSASRSSSSSSSSSRKQQAASSKQQQQRRSSVARIRDLVRRRRPEKQRRLQPSPTGSMLESQ